MLVTIFPVSVEMKKKQREHLLHPTNAVTNIYTNLKNLILTELNI